ncbi:MAG: N-acetylmuramoyl-L-alanine amidase [Bacillota bacterium]|jgi:N-acetylmuramoyl-L-alanine amidase
MPKSTHNKVATSILAAAAILLLASLIVPIRGYAAPLLRKGSYGDNVTTLQKYLQNAGFSPGYVDGDFGPKTQSAVIAFQRSSGLVPDGIVGPLTWTALERANNVSRGTGPLKGRVIVIDPGHGGAEPGAISYWGDKEKAFTLAIAAKVRYYLESQGAAVIMTRYGDYSPGSDWSPPADDLLARVSIANSRDADLFVSIHINAYPRDPGVSGVMGFYRNGSWESQKLAQSLANGVSSAAGLRFIDVQMGPYYVLNHTYMPAALIEVGFMTNWNDVNLLKQNWFQDSVAKGLARGIGEFLVR